jgi:hypothetical protein
VPEYRHPFDPIAARRKSGNAAAPTATDLPNVLDPFANTTGMTRALEAGHEVARSNAPQLRTGATQRARDHVAARSERLRAAHDVLHSQSSTRAADPARWWRGGEGLCIRRAGRFALARCAGIRCAIRTRRTSLAPRWRADVLHRLPVCVLRTRRACPDRHRLLPVGRRVQRAGGLEFLVVRERCRHAGPREAAVRDRWARRQRRGDPRRAGAGFPAPPRRHV